MPESPSSRLKTPRLSVPRSEEMLLHVRYCKASQIDIRLCYQTFGDPADARPVILLVSGLNMQLFAWDEEVCEDLVRAGFFVIRYDNRDIGYSTKIEQRGSVVGPRLLLPTGWASALGERLPYTMDDMARDGLALLQALGVPRAHVWGISMGGMIAQCMALLAPEVVLSLTSIMSATNASDLPDAQMWVKLWMLRKPPPNCSVDELLKFRVKSLKRLLEHALPVDEAYLKQRYLISLNRSSYSAGLIRQAATVRRCPSRDEDLTRLSIPALVIHGAQDLVVPAVHGFRTASVIPHARLLVLKSMGHYFHPAFFPVVIAAFADMASTTSDPGFPLEPHAMEYSNTGESTQSSAVPVDGQQQRQMTPLSSTMASIGGLLRPVVTTPATRTGKAAIRAVNVAVPGTGDPMLPEAVLIDLHSEATATTTKATSAKERTTDHKEGEEEVNEVDTVPYIVGSPSTWNHASFPSPVRKTERGGLVAFARSAEDADTAAAPVVPVIVGTPLTAVLAQDNVKGTETTGGRRSRPPSRLPSRQHSRTASLSRPHEPHDDKNDNSNNSNDSSRHSWSKRARAREDDGKEEVIEGSSAAPPLSQQCAAVLMHDRADDEEETKHPALRAEGTSPEQGIVDVLHEEPYIDPNSVATAEDVATTLLPPVLAADLEDLPASVDDPSLTEPPSSATEDKVN